MRYGFFIVMLSIFLATIAYTLLRGMQVFAPIGNLKQVYLGVMLTLFGTFIVGMFFSNFLPALPAKIFSFIGFTFFIILLYLFLSFFLTDIIRAFNHFIPFISNVPKFRLWMLVGSMALIAGALIVGNYKFNRPEVVQLEIQSAKPLQDRELKIAALSDVHLGAYIDKSLLQKYVGLINAQNPDVVIIAGDLIDRSLKPVLAQKMDDDLREIKAPLGVYACLGNHEYYGEGGQMLLDFFKNSHITLLRDSSMLINNEFYIVGREDKVNPGRKKTAELVAGFDPSKPVILMDHQPSELKEAAESGIDFQFSGHTHNAQFFPGNLFVKNLFELAYGYLRKGNSHFYTSSGLGIWGPQYRIGTQSELVVVKFKY